MYTPLQQKRYALNHLEAGCWYLDCPTGYTPDEEVQIRQTLDSASTPPAGASDVVDITEEEPVQPAPDEGSAPKKKRMTGCEGGCREGGCSKGGYSQARCSKGCEGDGEAPDGCYHCYSLLCTFISYIGYGKSFPKP